MPVRLLRPYAGQAVGTTYHGTDETVLLATGTADSRIELATDYNVSTRTVTTSTVTASQNNLQYYMNSASAQTITIPISGYWPLGTVLTIIQIGTGAFTIVAATGVTINTALSSLISKGRYNVAQLEKVAPDTWIAFGGIGG